MGPMNERHDGSGRFLLGNSLETFDLGNGDRSRRPSRRRAVVQSPRMRSCDMIRGSKSVFFAMQHCCKLTPRITFGL